MQRKTNGSHVYNSLKKIVQKRAKRRTNPAFGSKPNLKMTPSITIDLALAMFRVFEKHGWIGPLPNPANDKDFTIPPFAGGKLQ